MYIDSFLCNFLFLCFFFLSFFFSFVVLIYFPWFCRTRCGGEVRVLYSCPKPSVSSIAKRSFSFNCSKLLYGGKSRRLKHV